MPQGGTYRYDLNAQDPDHEPLTYELVSGSAGMTLDSLGRVKWQTALDSPIGPRSAIFTVRDGHGGSATQSVTFNVVADTTAPRISVIVQNGILFPWSTQPALVKVVATDDVGVTTITLMVDGVPVALSPDGTTTVFFSTAGKGRLEAFAFDAAGNKGRGLAQVRMRSGTEDGSGNENAAPAVAITSISDGDQVLGFVTVTRTAASQDLSDYVLSYRRGDESTFHEIGRGTASVTNGVLGKWDTTLLENDQYVLKLEATDAFGNFAAVEREVGVSGNFKLGNFRLSFSDITIPVAGIPITLARTYDSLRADRDGDLGFGWSLEFRNTNLRTGLAKSGLEDLGIYSAFKPGTKVYLTLPGGSREGFTFTPDIRTLGGFGNSLTIATPRFTPDRGVKDTLSVRGGTYIVNDFGELTSGGGQPYNPAAEEFGGYTLTTPDGTAYRINGNTGLLTSVTDRNANTLTFTDSGITGPGGTSLTFERDARGRVTKLSDPAGNSVQYGYDSHGDLVRVTDRMGNVTQYAYKTTPAHYLEIVTDPLGRTGIRAEYGADGRLAATVGGDGSTVHTTYDPNNSLVTVTDPLGNPTAFEYDNRGNVVTETDALGNSKRHSYDENNYEIATVDQLGNTTRYTYDFSGNVLSETDPLGNVRRKTFDRFGQVTTDTDPLGRTTQFSYDKVGNPQFTIDPAGARTTYESDAAGNPLRTIDPLGAVTRYTTDAAGQITSTTDALGHTALITYTATGLVAGTSTTVTQADGSIRTMTTAKGYDASDRLLSEIDAEGNVVRAVYNAASQRTASIDARGNRTEYEYDDAGRLVRTRFPDGTLTQTSYDAAGRVVSVTDQAGNVTWYVRDAVGQQLVTIKPDATPADLTDNPRLSSSTTSPGGRPRRSTNGGTAPGPCTTWTGIGSTRPTRSADTSAPDTTRPVNSSRSPTRAGSSRRSITTLWARRPPPTGPTAPPRPRLTTNSAGRWPQPTRSGTPPATPTISSAG